MMQPITAATIPAAADPSPAPTTTPDELVRIIDNGSAYPWVVGLYNDDDTAAAHRQAILAELATIPDAAYVAFRIASYLA